MDSLITFAKDNFDLITLLLGVAGVVVGIVSLILEIKKRKHNSEKQ